VSFRNNYNLESSGGVFFDGGVLEVSSPNINGGAFTDVTDPAIGGSFALGGYNGTISNDSGSPIAGRQAWSGNSGGYITTVVNLGPNVNGQTIKLKFRMASDTSGAGVGWRIDTIAFSGVCHILIPTPTPSPTSTPPGQTPTPLPGTPTPTASPPPTTKAVNLSTRMRVQTGDNVGIGGVIITGNTPKRLLFRGIGPSLAQLNVPNVLADPTLEIHEASTGSIIVNDNWRDGGQAFYIEPTGLAPTNNLESAILGTFAPGPLTVIVKGKNNTSGVALVEIYDLTPGVASKMANLSTRALVGTGDNIVIAGFTLGGNTNDDRIVVRGIGPSLTALGISNALADPTLELRDANGALLITNNDWQDNPDQAVEINAAGLAPTNNLESALAARLPPGPYTALLAGRNGGVGIGLVEVYDRGAP
jgi:hypothetical protein